MTYCPTCDIDCCACDRMTTADFILIGLVLNDLA